MSNYRGKKSSDELDEVKELLRATEDAMVLKLSVDAHHTSRTSSLSSSSSPLDDDLIRRFEALKAPAVSSKITSVPSRSGEKKKDGDVFARLADLKGGGSSVESNVNPESEMVGKEEEDEVEKLIQWAVDAARLDPSLSDDEEQEEADDDNSSDIDEDEDEDEEEEKDVKKKQSKKEEKPVK